MATTQTQGFPHPVPGDPPDVPTDIRALAEALDTKISALDATISDLQSRTTALEDGTGGAGWIPIAQGTDSGDTFVVDLTAGGKFPDPPLWTVVKVYARVDLSEAEDVLCRINGDTDAVYTSGSAMLDSNQPADSDDSNWWFPDNTVWSIGHLSTISTGVLDFQLIHAHADPGLMSFQCLTSRQSSTDRSVHRHTIASGSLLAAKTATSLEFIANSTATFVNVYWRALGLRMTHPS